MWSALRQKIICTSIFRITQQILMTLKSIHFVIVDSMRFISVALATFRSPNDTLQKHNDHKNSYVLGRCYLPFLKSCEQSFFLFTLQLPCLLVSCMRRVTSLSVTSSSNNSNQSFTVAFVLSCSANPHYSVGLSSLLTHFTFSSSA